MPSQPIFEPTYFNIEYAFSKIYSFVLDTFGFLFNGHTWQTIGLVSILLSIFFLAIIIFSLVRMFEIQAHEHHEIAHEIAHAKEKNKERNRNDNPRWKYVLTLMQSPNESDWRVAIIEADSILEEALKEKGLSGTTVSELLDGARGSGYNYVQDAWDAHIIRNKIAHDGSDYALSQIEARRILKMFQNFFEEIKIV